MINNYLQKTRIRIVLALVFSLATTFLLSGIVGKNKPNQPYEFLQNPSKKLATVPRSIIDKAYSGIRGVISSVHLNFYKPDTGLDSLDQISQTNSNKKIGFSKISPQPTTIPQPSPTKILTPTHISPTITAIPVIIPTKKPKPTKRPTPTPFVVGKHRPGKNRDEATEIAGKLACAPPSLIKAINDIECGGKSRLDPDFELYNTYDWWNDKKTTESQICQVCAYNECTGIIPSDSRYAGDYCIHPYEGYCSVDIGIVGPVQMSNYEFNAYKEKAKKMIHANSVDRRVAFDAFLLAGMHFRNISTYRGNNCSNWDLKYITKVACKYAGGCQYDYNGVSGDYCVQICEKYNSYAGTHYNCSKAPKLVDASCNIK